MIRLQYMVMSKGRSIGKWQREDRVVSEAELDWLLSPEGQVICREMAESSPADTPAAIEKWRMRLSPELVAAAWGQVVLRQAARGKFDRADEMLFDRVGFEQASSEAVARHKAKRFSDCSMIADFCCGIGGDTLALAGQGAVIGIDWLSRKLRMASHNVAVYGNAMSCQQGDVNICRPDAEAAHIDPDRRAGGKREHQPVFSSPDADGVRRIVEHYQHVAIKLSPGADFASLPFDGEVELISEAGNCKQAVVWTGRFQQVARRATVLPSGQSLTGGDETDRAWPAPADPQVGSYLYEPDAAVIRADLVGVLARAHDLRPIDSRIVLLTGSNKVSSNLMTSFTVLEVLPFSLKKVRAMLMSADIGRVDVKTRGFAASPEDILRKLRLKGRRHAILFLTRIAGQAMAVLAERTEHAPGAD